jgi:hypothetical protein
MTQKIFQVEKQFDRKKLMEQTVNGMLFKPGNKNKTVLKDLKY